MTIQMFFIIVAMVCWLIASYSWNTEKPIKVNIGWLGMFFYGLSMVIR